MATRDPWPGSVHPAALIDAVVKSAFAPALRSAGFTRRSRTWRRRPHPRLTQVLNLQASPWNAVARDYVERTRAAFTVNLGLHVEGVDELVGSSVTAGLPLEHECQVRLRIGELLEGGADRWWEMSSDEDIPVVTEVISEILRDVALPWFDEYSSVSAVRRWFDNPPPGALVLADVPAALDALLRAGADGER